MLNALSSQNTNAQPVARSTGVSPSVVNPPQICAPNADEIVHCVPNPWYQAPQTPEQTKSDLESAAILMVPGLGPEGFVAKEVGGEAIASGALSRFGAGALDALKDTRTLGQKFVEGAAEGLGQLAVGGAGIVTGALLHAAVSAHPPAQSSAAPTQSKPTPKAIP